MKNIAEKCKFLLINVVVAIVVICGIAIYILSWLKDYTQHGQFIEVPVLQQMTPQEAATIATDAHLRTLVIDSIFDDDALPGVVVEQYPSPGTQVKENRLVHLTINAHSPKKIVVPNLRNAAYRQTLQTLEARGFKIGNIEYMPSEFKNLVLQLKHNGQEISPDTLLRKGAVIDIVLGDGGGNNLLNMPLLLGKSLQEALDLIRKFYLNIGPIVTDGSITTDKNQLEAIVYQQNPEYDSSIEAATPVELFITFDEKKIKALDTLIIKEPLP
jgi:beta-lactam-binding protein with PASTA domain